MKLGIGVVHILNEASEPLLDLHLRQIKQYTTVPYTIYANVNRLEPKYRQRLERQPRIRHKWGQ